MPPADRNSKSSDPQTAEGVARLLATFLDQVEEGLLVYVPGVVTYRNDAAHDPLRDLELEDGLVEARKRWFKRYDLYDVDGDSLVPVKLGEGPVAKAMAGQIVEKRLYRVHQLATGLDRYYETSCRPFKLDEDGPTGFVITTVDLTHRALDSKALLGSERRRSMLLDLAAPASLIIDRQGKVYDRRDGGMTPLAEFDPHAEGSWSQRFRLTCLSTSGNETEEECSFLERIVWPVLRDRVSCVGTFSIQDRTGERCWRVLVRGTFVAADGHGPELPFGDCALLTFSPIE